MAADGEAGERRRLSLPGLPYVQDFVGAYANIVTDQFVRLDGILERMGGGDYTPEQLIADATWLATEWIRDVAQIGTMWQSSVMADALPTMVFVVDGTAEGADPKEIPVAMRIGRTVGIAVTPLTRIPEGGTIGPEKVQATLTDRHARLRVAISDISKLPAGHYLGWVYLDAEGSKKPLAALHVVKLGAESASAGRSGRAG
jgi:hypothetical protein